MMTAPLLAPPLFFHSHHIYTLPYSYVLVLEIMGSVGNVGIRKALGVAVPLGMCSKGQARAISINIYVATVLALVVLAITHLLLLLPSFTA